MPSSGNKIKILKKIISINQVYCGFTQIESMISMIPIQDYKSWKNAFKAFSQLRYTYQKK